MRLTRENFAIYIVTYNRPVALNKSIRFYLDSLPFVPHITVISNHTNCAIDTDLQPHVNLIYNHLRPNESWGYLARNWNQCFQLGLREHEWLLCSQDDVIVKPGWFELVNDTDYDFYLAPLGDTRFLLNRSAFRNVGWFDERFVGIGYHEHDYILRILSLISDRASIVDMHPQLIRHNPISLEDYWYQPEPEGFDKFAQRTVKRHTYLFSYFYQKWNIHPFKKIIGLHKDRLPKEIDWYPFISDRYEYLKITNPQYSDDSVELRSEFDFIHPEIQLISIPRTKLIGSLILDENTKHVDKLLHQLFRHVSDVNRNEPGAIGLVVLDQIKLMDSAMETAMETDSIEIVTDPAWNQEVVAMADFLITPGWGKHNLKSLIENKPVWSKRQFLRLTLTEVRERLELNDLAGLLRWYIKKIPGVKKLTQIVKAWISDRSPTKTS